MEIIDVDYSRLSSLLMGKLILFPWRSQSYVCFRVDYNQWLKFVNTYNKYLIYKLPHNYSAICKSNVDDVLRRKYFYYDMALAQYSELLISARRGLDSTLILPYSSDKRYISLDAMGDVLSSLGHDELLKYKNRLESTMTYYAIKVGNIYGDYGKIKTKLSRYNTSVLAICLFYIMCSTDYCKNEKLNIDLEDFS